MTQADRRSWLRWVGAGGALPLAMQGAAIAAESPPPKAEGYGFLSAFDIAFLTAAVDRLIPADAFPSASQAGVVIYIDRQLAGDYGAGSRLYLKAPWRAGTPQQGYQLGLPPASVYRRSLDALASHETGLGFARRLPAEQDGFLRELEAGRWMLQDVPSSVFFETLLSNTIEGYFADPQYGGNRDMAGWRMVGFPGAFANFAQWVGHHGVQYPRPPMSIAMTMVPSAPGHGSHKHGDHGAHIPASARPSKNGERTR